MKDDFGVRLSMLIKTHNMTNSELAHILDVTPITISRYINNKGVPNLNFIERILKEFPDLNLAWFISGKGEMLNKSDLNSYEYFVETFDSFDQAHQQQYINERSKQGWELVNVVYFIDTDKTPCFRFYFKKEK